MPHINHSHSKEVIHDLETSFKRVIDHITAIVLPVKHKQGAPLSNTIIPSLPTGPGKQTNLIGESRNKVQESKDTPGLYSTISKNVRSFPEKLTEPMLKRPYQVVNPPSTQVFTQEPSHLIEGHTTRTAPSRGIRRSRAFQKISQIKADRAKGVLTCYRCGEKNHLSRDCRNPIICFECGKVGHRSSNCRSISQPKPSFSISSNPPILPIRGNNMDKQCVADEYALLQFTPNDANKDLQEVLNRSIMIHDERSLGALYIQAHLQQRFNFPGFAWVAKAIPNNRFLVDPPNPIWRATSIEFGTIDLGGIRFPVEGYDKIKHDIQGHPPIPLWIKIKGLPYRFFKTQEFERISNDLGGGVLLEVDPRSGNHYDFTILRLRVGVCDREVVPPFRKLKFTEQNGIVSFYTLFYEVEDDLNQELLEIDLEMGNKRKAFWQEKSKGNGSGSNIPDTQGDNNRSEFKRGRLGESQG
jgi:Domain of unknown function (DUF4283)/Zinc knuckle